MARKKKIQINPLQASASTSVGSDTAALDIGVSPSGIGVTPQLSVSSNPNAQAGSEIGQTLGGAAGTAVGGPVGGFFGAAAGSAGGSIYGKTIGKKFGKSKGGRESEARKNLLAQYQKIGLFDKDGSFIFPDGTKGDFSGDGLHAWKDPTRRVSGKDRELYGYETDYTNDLDYVASMAGISLSRIVSGGKGKATDQIGQTMGNQFLGSAGYGANFDQKNFNTVMNNARAQYARAGIQSKDEMIALSNQMLADGRISDADYAVMQQTAGMMFGNDYSTAQALMAGRWKGLETASQAPAQGQGQQQIGNDPRNKPGRIFSPVVSPEEAIMSVQPFFDHYRATYPGIPRNRRKEDFADFMSTVGEISAGIGVASAGIQTVGSVINIGTRINEILNPSPVRVPQIDIANETDLTSVTVDPQTGNLGTDSSLGIPDLDLGGFIF